MLSGDSSRNRPDLRRISFRNIVADQDYRFGKTLPGRAETAKRDASEGLGRPLMTNRKQTEAVRVRRRRKATGEAGGRKSYGIRGRKSDENRSCSTEIIFTRQTRRYRRAINTER